MEMLSVARIALGLVAGVLLLYALVVGVLALNQNKLVYVPQRVSEPQARAQAAAAGFLPWEVGGKLIGWRSPKAGAGANRVIVYHGNAGMAVDRTFFRDGFLAQPGRWEVFVLEYPGFGPRPGPSTRASVLGAARDALKAVEAEGTGPIYVLGESLGSGVASAIAGESPDRVAGVVLMTPFTRLADAAAHHYPWAPVRLILREDYDNESALRGYRGPVAIVLAGHDSVVPTPLGQRLYDGYGARKRLWIQEPADHNTMDYNPQSAFWKDLVAFLQDQGASSATARR